MSVAENIQTQSSYNILSKLLHWTVVLLLLSQFITIWTSQVALRMGSDFRPFGYEMLDLHKALGVLVLCVAAIRLIWRWVDCRIGPLDWRSGRKAPLISWRCGCTC